MWNVLLLFLIFFKTDLIFLQQTRVEEPHLNSGYILENHVCLHVSMADVVHQLTGKNMIVMCIELEHGTEVHKERLDLNGGAATKNSLFKLQLWILWNEK